MAAPSHPGRLGLPRSRGADDGGPPAVQVPGSPATASGYAACPDLDDQRALFELLHPEDIGVTLTDGSMMDPEASVSAMVFQHPDCIYFDVNS